MKRRSSGTPLWLTAYLFFEGDVYLRGAITRNPRLRVLVASGHFDLATPYFDAFYTVDHLGLPEALRGNVKIATYEAGHMMYIRRADHRKLKADIAELLRSAVAP